MTIFLDVTALAEVRRLPNSEAIVGKLLDGLNAGSIVVVPEVHLGVIEHDDRIHRIIDGAAPNCKMADGSRDAEAVGILEQFGGAWNFDDAMDTSIFFVLASAGDYDPPRILVTALGSPMREALEETCQQLHIQHRPLAMLPSML